nr:DedA family protein [Sutcliffiella horikoshii]
MISLIGNYGYAALFFCLWLGIVGMPIPDEVIVMSGGIVSSIGILQPIPAFLLTYLGVVSGLSIGYILGRVMGVKVVDRVLAKQKNKHLLRAQHLLEKYNHYALALSYFIPFVRHIVPYLVGINKMSFKRYALYSYTTGFFWTLSYFILGATFGEHIEMIADLAFQYGLWFGILLGIGILTYFLYNKTNTYKRSKQNEKSDLHPDRG